MRKKTAATILAAGLVTGGGAALFVPSVALAADAGSGDQSPTDRAAARLTSIKDALKGLVSDGTITQAQADKVAATLAESGFGGPGGRGGHGPGGHGPGGRVSAEAAAKIIGITVDQLRTAQQSGQTLAQIAEAHGVAKADLIKGLVEAAKTQLAADVKAGKLTQAQADEITSNLTARITERVDRAGRAPGNGPGGPGNDKNTPTPSATTS